MTQKEKRTRTALEAVTLRVEHPPDQRDRVDPFPALILPLDRTVAELSLGAAAEAQRLDRSSFFLVPARTRYRIESSSPAPRVVTLLLGEAARTSAIREYRPHVVPERLDTVLGSALLLVRTRWFDELVHRYVFERETCGKHTSAAARFLEIEMTKEVFFLGQERLEQRVRSSVVHEGSPVVERARAWIEDNLFATLRIQELARHCKASESTLLRAFRREIGTTPYAYLLDRRLDEALLLLESGRYTVSEVATRIGYANLSAFTAAFRRRFKALPSSVQRPATRAAALAPHGDPPKARRRQP